LQQLADDCECREEVALLVDYLADLSRFVRAMSMGDLSATINRRGALAGALKGLHANLRHLTWQTQQVAAGDFKQRVDFLGEFSTAFNSMVVALNQAREDLVAKNQQLAEAFDELKSTQVQLLQQAKMASVGQLAAGVAHEINNPMGFIASNLGTLRSYSKSLARYVATADQLALHYTEDGRLAMAGLRESLDLDFLLQDLPVLINESVNGATRVRDIVLALKSFSNLDQSTEQQLDVNDCMENTIAVAGNTLDNRSKLVRDYGTACRVVGNPQELGQLFLNLLINADQAIASGGEIKVSSHSDGNSVFLTVPEQDPGVQSGHGHCMKR
jgi:signal transduction histidine kinase